MTYLLGQFTEEDIRLVSMEGVSWREIDVELLLEGLDHVVVLSRTLEVQRILLAVLALKMELERRLAVRDHLDDALDKRLRYVHHVVHVRVGM